MAVRINKIFTITVTMADGSEHVGYSGNDETLANYWYKKYIVAKGVVKVTVGRMDDYISK